MDMKIRRNRQRLFVKKISYAELSWFRAKAMSKSLRSALILEDIRFIDGRSGREPPCMILWKTLLPDESRN